MPSFEEILLRVVGDKDDAERDLNELSRELLEFDRIRAEATAELDATQLRAELRDARERLRALSAVTATPEIEVATAKAKAEIKTLRARLAELAAQEYEVDVDVDSRGTARLALARLVTGLGRLGAGLRDLRHALTPASVRIGRFSFSVGRLGQVAGVVASVAMKALQASLVAVASSAALAVSGILSMITALGSATIAAGQLAGAYTLAFVSTLVPAVVLGIGVVQRFKDTVEDAGSAAARLKAAADDLTKTFARALAPAADRVLGALAFGLGRLEPLVRRLRPAFARFGTEVAKNIRTAATELTSPAWERGFNRLIDGARRIIGPLIDAFLGLGATIRNIAVATMPLLEGAIRRLAGRTREWASATRDAGAIRGFLRDAQREVSIFGDLLRALGDLAGAAFGGAASEGRKLVRELTKAAEQAATFLRTAEGQRRVNRFWAEAADHLRTWAKAGAQVVDMLAALISLAAPFGAELVEKIGDAAERFADWLRSAEGTERVQRFLSEMIPLLEEIAELAFNLIRGFLAFSQIAAAALTPLLRVLNVLASAFASVAEFLEAKLTGPVRALAGAILFVIGPIKFLRAGLAVLRAAFRVVAGASSALRGAVLGVGTAFSALPKLVAGAVSAVGDLAGGIVALVKKAWADLKEATSKVWSQITDALEKSWDALSAGASKVWSGIQTAISKSATATKDAVVAAFNALSTATRGAWSAIRTVVTTAARTARDVAVTAFSALRDRARAIWNAIRSAIATAARGARDVAVSVFAAIRDRGRAIFDALRGAVSSAWGAIRDRVSGAARGARDAAVGAFDSLRDRAVSIVQGLVSRVGSIIGRLASVFSQAINTALKVIGGLAGAFFSAGRNLIQSFINGITSLAGAVAGAVGSVVGKARDLLPFSEPKDSSSPLRGLGDAGEALIDNILAGIRRASGRIPAALAAELAGVSGSLSGHSGAAAAAGQTSVTQHFAMQVPAGGVDPVESVAVLAALMRQRGGTGL